MPKMKTRKSAAKRFRSAGKGKFKFKKAGLRHLLSARTTNRKRNLRRGGYVSKANQKQVEGMLPYGAKT
ncbi:MAG: 50S ribosomal protein L35 [Deltaproteobacteria bacterium]|nr:50S ribosomal protein L35 [Deltaproteobacteria bacterium]